MEKRTCTLIIRFETKDLAPQVNAVLSRHSGIILSRLGLPGTGCGNIISLIIEGSTDEIGSLTGQLGRLRGVEVKSALFKSRENDTTNP